MIRFAENLNKMIAAGLGEALEAPRTEVAVGHRIRYLESSGAVASFETNIVAPIRSLRVDMQPIQDLHGQDAPYPAGGGKNLLPNDLSSGTIKNGVTVFVDASGVISFSGTSTAITIINIKTDVNNVLETGVNYIISGCTGGTFETYRFEIYKNVGNNVVNYNGDTPFSLLDTDSGCSCRIVIASGINMSGVKIFPMIRLASVSDSTFAPYSNICPIRGRDSVTVYQSGEDTTYYDSITVQLGQTIYGGTVDVTNGTMMVEWENIASYDGEALPGEWISDRDAYAPGTTPTTGAQVCYKLATPLTIQLTPAQLSTLVGENNVWCDAGDVALEYPYYEETEGY